METDPAEYPTLLLPYTYLAAGSEVPDNMLVDVTIMSIDTEGNNTCIYSGLCNIKFMDSHDDVNNQFSKTPEHTMIDSDDNQSEVWIDPARSPHVFNQSMPPHVFNQSMPQELYVTNHSMTQDSYSVCQQTSTSITVQKNNTYVSKYKYQKLVHYSNHKDFEKNPKPQASEQQNLNRNMYEEDKVGCGAFLSKPLEEIINEKQKQDTQERKFIGIKSDNKALQQLMSPGILSSSKQVNTILYVGQDSQSGQTIHRIGYYDVKGCSGQPRVDNEVIIDDTNPPKGKRYQCASCKQIFDQIADFHKHMDNHSDKQPKFEANRTKSKGKSSLPFFCEECDKGLKNKTKFNRHRRGHGNPDRQCSICNKVFVTKHTLRVHRKTHSRNAPQCTETDSKLEETTADATEIHHISSCARSTKISEVYQKSRQGVRDSRQHAHHNAELKRHCSDKYELEIPTDETLLKN